MAGVYLSALSAAPIAPDVLYRQASASIWIVLVNDAQGKLSGTGSAVVTGPELMVTNCHVLKDAAAFVVRQGSVVHTASLLHADTERDLCQLQVPQLQSPAVSVASQEPVIGQRVYAIGAPRGLEATLSDGLVSALRRDATGQLTYIQISAPISPGSSGGGLFDDSGRLIGITTSGIVGVAQNLNFARPAQMIADVPQRSAIALRQWRQKAGPAAQAAPAAPAAAAPPALVPPARTPAASTSPTVPRAIASGYATLEDVDAVPYLNDAGREGYRKFLTRPTPRAFVVAPDGRWSFADGVRVRDPALPTDPSERAMVYCVRRTEKPGCQLYAVNGSVVWTRPAPSIPTQ